MSPLSLSSIRTAFVTKRKNHLVKALELQEAASRSPALIVDSASRTDVAETKHRLKNFLKLLEVVSGGWIPTASPSRARRALAVKEKQL